MSVGHPPRHAPTPSPYGPQKTAAGQHASTYARKPAPPHDKMMHEERRQPGNQFFQQLHTPIVSPHNNAPMTQNQMSFLPWSQERPGAVTHSSRAPEPGYKAPNANATAFEGPEAAQDIAHSGQPGTHYQAPPTEGQAMGSNAASTQAPATTAATTGCSRSSLASRYPEHYTGAATTPVQPTNGLPAMLQGASEQRQGYAMASQAQVQHGQYTPPTNTVAQAPHENPEKYGFWHKAGEALKKAGEVAGDVGDIPQLKAYSELGEEHETAAAWLNKDAQGRAEQSEQERQKKYTSDLKDKLDATHGGQRRLVNTCR